MDIALREKLCRKSVAAIQHAYCPYSRFSVGAAVLTVDDRIFCGANVENASYGLTICAERVAAVAAVNAGHLRFQAVAVTSPGGHSPCGACRQFLAEFDDQTVILLIDSDRPDVVRETTLDDLLPDRFTSDDLP